MRKPSWRSARAATLLTLAFLATGHVGAQATGDPAAQAAAIVALARDAMTSANLRAVILRVTVDGQELVTAALGESLTGVPATPDMHFRNGAVAISYMATLLLQLVDQGRVSLDDPLSLWLPDLPDADTVTLRMLANMTAGYPDYVQNERLDVMLYADPFRHWTPQELISLGLSTPRAFAPGTNWDYSHTNYVILGQALEQITKTPLATLMRENILRPLALNNTFSSETAQMPEPVLHAYSSERRNSLGVVPSTRFYEESTYWNPSWTLAPGAVQTTNIYDMTMTAEGVGTGALLSHCAHTAQIDPTLRGFGSPLPGCPTCHPLGGAYIYGLGVVLNGPWILQNPVFGGYGAVEAYLPSRRIAVAVVTTFGEKAFDQKGINQSERASTAIFSAIATFLAPDEAPLSPAAR